MEIVRINTEDITHAKTLESVGDELRKRFELVHFSAIKIENITDLVIDRRDVERVL